MSPLTLAFLGDAVFELLVRERMIQKGNAPVNKLHKQTVKMVCATAQARAMEVLAPLLTEEETPTTTFPKMPTLRNTGWPQVLKLCLVFCM